MELRPDRYTVNFKGFWPKFKSGFFELATGLTPEEAKEAYHVENENLTEVARMVKDELPNLNELKKGLADLANNNQ